MANTSRLSKTSASQKKKNKTNEALVLLSLWYQLGMDLGFSYVHPDLMERTTDLLIKASHTKPIRPSIVQAGKNNLRIIEQLLHESAG